MEKLRVMDLNKDLREKAFAKINEAQKINALGSQYGLNIEGLDGEYHFVRIDIVVPKDSADCLLEDYLEIMEAKEQEKQEKALEKEKAKQAKIEKDNARRLAKQTKVEE